jgi:F-type H+-transporting ATPase subunit c
MLSLFALVQDAVGGAGDIGAGIAIVGAGLVVLGAGLGIGRIGGNMTEAMARQPEAAGQIQTGAIILAALIEGVAFFGLVIAGFLR